MARTVTIEVPDDLAPALDKVLAYWRRQRQNTDAITLQHILRHGVNMMGYRDGLPGPDENPFRAPRIDGLTNDLGDDIPF